MSSSIDGVIVSILSDRKNPPGWSESIKQVKGTTLDEAAQVSKPTFTGKTTLAFIDGKSKKATKLVEMPNFTYSMVLHKDELYASVGCCDEGFWLVNLHKGTRQFKRRPGGWGNIFMYRNKIHDEGYHGIFETFSDKYKGDIGQGQHLSIGNTIYGLTSSGITMLKEGVLIEKDLPAKSGTVHNGKLYFTAEKNPRIYEFGGDEGEKVLMTVPVEQPTGKFNEIEPINDFALLDDGSVIYEFTFRGTHWQGGVGYPLRAEGVAHYSGTGRQRSIIVPASEKYTIGSIIPASSAVIEPLLQDALVLKP